MKKVLVVGSATVDLLWQSDALESRQQGQRWSLAHGGKYIAERFLLLFGGGGANAATTLSRQKLNVTFMTKVGAGLMGRLVINNLRDHNINTDLVQIGSKEATPASAIIIDKTGDKTIINYRGQGDDISLSRAFQKILPKTSWLALYSLPHLPKREKLRLLALCEHFKIPCLLSLHGTEYKKGLSYLKPYFNLTTILHLNAYEMADLLDVPVSKINFYQRNFCQELNVPIVIVTYDERGSFAYTKEKIYYQDIFRVRRVVDTTGAGDAYSSAFLAGFIRTGDIQKAMRLAAANAASVIQKYGAQKGLLKASS